ncbi:hypothetical protein N7G274_004252 [Stereocaulon virgatum]|uniref:RING-type domain-containing protein n=1 Tax=Stereocaulon virgatum TaxID=373712 RepID=A0ABR4ABE8_9LECA
MHAPTRPNFSSLQPLQTHQEPITTNLPTPDYSPLSSPQTPLFPPPLKISKRPFRKLSATIPPRRSSLADTASQVSFEYADDALTPRAMSIASMPNPSPPELQLTTTPPPTASTPPRRTSSTSVLKFNCSICKDPLSPLQSYSFPKTAPAISLRIHSLCPGIDSSPTFCATCFEAIRAIHVCWGCGEDIHRREERSPLPPPPWTSKPTTLSVPPSCKACTRELRELAYQERMKKQASTPAARVGHGAESDRSMSRKISLGVRYPPLPRWMEKLPGNKSAGKGTGVAVKWMEKLPGNRKQRSGSGSGSGNGRGVASGGDGYGSVRQRIVVGGL